MDDHTERDTRNVIKIYPREYADVNDDKDEEYAPHADVFVVFVVGWIHGPPPPPTLPPTFVVKCACSYFNVRLYSPEWTNGSRYKMGKKVRGVVQRRQKKMRIADARLWVSCGGVLARGPSQPPAAPCHPPTHRIASRQVGSGYFGEVFLALDRKRNDRKVVVKTLKVAKKEEVKLNREIMMLETLKHGTNIVLLMDTIQVPKSEKKGLVFEVRASVNA